MQPQLMTSNKDDWETPDSLYNRLNNIFHFSLDAAASSLNSKCALYLDESKDALKTDWQAYLKDNKASTDTVFLNPPYSHKLIKWFNKIKEEYEKGLTIVCLVAARTDTKWHAISWTYARQFIFFYGRLHFEVQGVASTDSATFPSELIVFSDHDWNLWPLLDLGHIMSQQVVSPKELRGLDYD